MSSRLWTHRLSFMKEAELRPGGMWRREAASHTRVCVSVYLQSTTHTHWEERYREQQFSICLDKNRCVWVYYRYRAQSPPPSPYLGYRTGGGGTRGGGGSNRSRQHPPPSSPHTTPASPSFTHHLFLLLSLLTSFCASPSPLPSYSSPSPPFCTSPTISSCPPPSVPNTLLLLLSSS